MGPSASISEAWRELDSGQRYSITIQEVPTARFGSTIRVQVGGRTVHRSLLRPNRQAARELAHTLAGDIFQGLLRTNNQGYIIQYGSGLVAYNFQGGSGNIGGILQSGEGHWGYLDQGGVDGRGSIYQTGIGNTGGVVQYGLGNFATIYQH